MPKLQFPMVFKAIRVPNLYLLLTIFSCVEFNFTCSGTVWDSRRDQRKKL